MDIIALTGEASLRAGSYHGTYSCQKLVRYSPLLPFRIWGFNPRYRKTFIDCELEEQPSKTPLELKRSVSLPSIELTRSEDECHEAWMIESRLRHELFKKLVGLGVEKGLGTD